MSNRSDNIPAIIISAILIFSMFGFGIIVSIGLIESEYSSEISDLKEIIDDLQFKNYCISILKFHTLL